MATSTATTRRHNKDLSRRFLEELWNQRNEAIIDELLADTYVDHTPPLTPDKESQGSEHLKLLFETVSQYFTDISVSIEEQMAEEDKVMTRVTWRCRRKGDDPSTLIPITIMGVSIDCIHRGRIVESWNKLDVLYRLLILLVLEKSEERAAERKSFLRYARAASSCAPGQKYVPGVGCVP